MSTRRFFYDDGKSRKRWHVSVQGKSLTVRFGRLTGKLRESKKSFKSPAEAQKNAEQLIAEKLREGYIEIDPSRLEIVRKKGIRPATEQQIVGLEKQVGSKLSDEYLSFLKTFNGGTPNPDCVQVPGRSDIENVGVGLFFHLRPSKPDSDELTFEVERTKELLPPEHLPIAGSSDLFTLSLAPQTFGAVYWWFHESEELDDEGNFLESAGYLLAGSFDEFLTRIAILFESAEDRKQASAEESQGRSKSSKASVKQLLRVVQQDHTPKTVAEIKRLINELGDLHAIEDGQWPFINLTDPEVLQCLLDAGLNPEVLDTERQSLLWQCASSPECIAMLVKRNVDVNRRSGARGETPLMRAIFLKESAAIQQLVKLGANPTLRLDKHLAHDLRRDAKLSNLIEKAQADWHKRPQPLANTQPIAKVQTPPASKKSKGPKPTLRRLLQLMKHDHIQEGEVIEGVGELVAELGDISAIQDGQWPNIDKFENPQLLGTLLDAGLNPEVTDKAGNTLLCQCVSHPDCIDLLIKRGVNVDRRNAKDETALMRASYVGQQDCVQRLLDAGANPTLEFSSFARVMIGMDQEMTAFIDAAREKWNRKNTIPNKSTSKTQK